MAAAKKEHLREREDDLGQDQHHDRPFQSHRSIRVDDFGEGAGGLSDHVEFGLQVRPRSASSYSSSRRA